jgi:hypothetical protein
MRSEMRRARLLRRQATVAVPPDRGSESGWDTPLLLRARWTGRKAFFFEKKKQKTLSV